MATGGGRHDNYGKSTVQLLSMRVGKFELAPMHVSTPRLCIYTTHTYEHARMVTRKARCDNIVVPAYGVTVEVTLTSRLAKQVAVKSRGASSTRTARRSAQRWSGPSCIQHARSQREAWQLASPATNAPWLRQPCRHTCGPTSPGQGGGKEEWSAVGGMPRELGRRS